MQTDTHALKREILAYLASLPRKIRTADAREPEIALALGNCLVWISGIIERGEPALEQPMTETPVSVHALGKHFRAVALELMDHRDCGYPVPNEAQRIGSLESVLESMQIRVQHLEKGGAK